VIVLDTSVLIAYFDPADQFHSDAVALLDAEIDMPWGINTLNLAEVLTGPTAAGREHLVIDALEDLEIEEIRFPSDAALRLAGLRASTRLKMPDCCVLLASEVAQGQVATFDTHLRQAAASLGLGSPSGQSAP
jgi:predicted nucleic acid-binding protein